MSRGNKRDVDRQRAANRNAKNAKGKQSDKDGLTKAQRQERDAAALAAKRAAKAAKKAAEEGQK